MSCFPAKQVQAPESEARAVESGSDDEFVAGQVELQLLPVLYSAKAGLLRRAGTNSKLESSGRVVAEDKNTFGATIMVV